jgi:hypothetical protein
MEFRRQKEKAMSDDAERAWVDFIGRPGELSLQISFLAGFAARYAGPLCTRCRGTGLNCQYCLSGYLDKKGQQQKGCGLPCPVCGGSGKQREQARNDASGTGTEEEKP